MTDRLPLDPEPWNNKGYRFTEYYWGFLFDPRAGYSQDEADYA